MSLERLMRLLIFAHDNSRGTIFRGEMICEETSLWVLVCFGDFRELALGGEILEAPGLDDFGFWVAGFFIKAKTGVARPH